MAEADERIDAAVAKIDTWLSWAFQPDAKPALERIRRILTGTEGAFIWEDDDG